MAERSRLRDSLALASRSLLVCAVSVVPVALSSGIVWAQSLPPSIRACAAETEADRRHACYDREVGRILDAERAAAARRDAPGLRAPRTETLARVEPKHTTAEQSSSTHGGAEPSGDRISARIVSIDDTPDELILHLDNGEVWQQTDRSSGGLGLRAGDSVRIERHFGSYWLSARHVSAMRVRRKSN